ncbi:hypothetical protein PR202_ga20727 [Eleusine coracana subsp. coracana]|uniref:Dioxygenase n=1 Tax=Eleusine coracana subsp. coracana TaxID=191504 RepID=A0AAV5CZC0_ELECO|nr:hypothetical protein PR202_ga20727 [Eleusine coracana subsp. coracana]
MSASLLTVPMVFSFSAARRQYRGKINLYSFRPAAESRSLTPLSVKATNLVAEVTARGCGAWTNVRQEEWEGDMAVEGQLPAWLNGTYLRIGPGVWQIGDHELQFDGYGTLLRVSFRRGCATGAHRQIESDAYKATREHGHPLLHEFSELIPIRPGNLLDRACSVVGLATGSVLSDNANTAVLQLGDGRVMCLARGHQERHPAFAMSMQIKINEKICTSGKVACVEVPPFLAIHFINAFEERRKEDNGLTDALIVDCCEHFANPAIIEALALRRLRSLDVGSHEFPDARVARFRIPLDGKRSGELETLLDPAEHGRAVEMSSINPAYQGKEYQYVYACGAHRPTNFLNTLTKIDLVGKETKSMRRAPCRPSPSFQTLFRTVDGNGYTLLLDAMTFKEIARVRFPYGLPYGFHGCWIPEKI